MTPAPLFRIAWARTAPARPLTQAEVAADELRLGLHGPGCAELKKSHHDDLPGDPWYLWSGTAAAPWAVSFRPRRGALDLGGDARVVLRSRSSGAARLRLIVADGAGDWWVSAAAVGASDDWREHVLGLSDGGWRQLEIDRVEADPVVATIDLSEVAAFGIADLFEPPRHRADCVRLDWLDVHGRFREHAAGVDVA